MNRAEEINSFQIEPHIHNKTLFCYVYRLALLYSFLQ